MVDDQGLEVSYTSLKPSKERRFSDIILIQYSKNTQNTQKKKLLALSGIIRKVLELILTDCRSHSSGMSLSYTGYRSIYHHDA